MDVTQVYLNELTNRNSTQEKTIELIKRARRGDEKARQEVIENYLLFVVKISKGYIHLGIPEKDIIQEGNMGLITALEKYDLYKGIISAKHLYAKAFALDSSNIHAQNQILEIDTMLVREGEKPDNEFIKKGDIFFGLKQYNQAKQAYENSLDEKLNGYARSKIAEIDGILEAEKMKSNYTDLKSSYGVLTLSFLELDPDAETYEDESKKFEEETVKFNSAKSLVEDKLIANLIEEADESCNACAPFGSYSKFWIKQSIIRNCMHNRRLVRLPENRSELMRQGRWKGEEHSEFSIDMPYEDGGSLSDKLPDFKEMDFLVEEENNIMSSKIEKILSYLKKRDCEVIKAHFGIGHKKPLDIKEIAELFGLTTTRINQIIRNSLKTLREVEGKPMETLEIVSATYGSDEFSIDVTNEIISMIEEGKIIKSSNKIAGDPCKGTFKYLFVEYTSEGKLYYKKFSEGSYVNF